MRIAQTQDFIKLREDGFRRRISKEKKAAIELANDIFSEAEEREQPFLYHTPESWAQKWLPSKRFTLMRLPLNAAAMPCEPKVDNLVLKKIHAMETKPIVVDYNRNQIGKSMHGFIPQIIVIDGKHRFKAASLRGETHIMAWVGELAMESMNALGGGGPKPEATTAAPGAKLVAQGSSGQEHRLTSRTGTFAEGTKLKELNVKNIKSGGPGSGRHPGGGLTKSKPHISLIRKIAQRGGIGTAGYTKNDEEHEMARQLASKGYLEKKGGGGASGGRQFWMVTMNGHVAFNHDQIF